MLENGTRRSDGELALSRRSLLAGSLAVMLPVSILERAEAATADDPSILAPRQLPARSLPVPDTVSAAMRPVVAAPYPPGWAVVPPDADAWRKLAAASGGGSGPVLAEIQEKLSVTVEESTIAGVHVYIVTPTDMPAANRDRLLVHVHGGGYVLYPGEVGAGEAMLLAGYGRFKIVSVDYRMAPDFPYPAALDDAEAVWRALVADNDPRRMAIFGTSAGGGLTLAMVLRAKELNLPLPAAIGLGSPWSDLTGDGDSLQANAYVDNVLVANTGWAGAAAALYAGAHDLRDPLISPIFGDFTDFPPAILTSGTRDLFLSDTVRTHRKLRQAGVEAALQVFEAQSHAQFLTPFAPETEEALGEVARFFDTHLMK
jgi:epsilon-lactone hydrolase